MENWKEEVKREKRIGSEKVKKDKLKLKKKKQN